MACVAAVRRDLPSCETVPRVHARDLTAEEFARRFMRPNLPVLIAGLTEDWKSRDQWVTTTDRADMDAMTAAFGDADVLVVDCDEPLDTDLGRAEVKFRDFARWWRSSRRGGVGDEKSDEKDGDDGDGSDDDARDVHDARRLYLKDWTFASDFPEYGAYETPSHFEDDWLNAYWERRGADADAAAADAERAESSRRGGTHKFVYAGVKGTTTPLHADVMRSFSWSVNVVGEKEWLLVPPSRSEVRSMSHWSPYDRVGVVNAVP